MRPLLLALTLCLTALAAGAARAQDMASLIADRILVRGEAVLIAEGNVEVFWRGARLRAERVIYDRAADRLTIEGPIVLTDGEDVAIFADAAELSADLRDGLMQSARLVLSERLQLAATEIARVGGRYTELSKVVTSSCQVCPQDPVPLWSIRARRVIHDQEERQIYFFGAQLRVMDVPVAYIPRLRFPDPTLKRATGFLFPSFRSTSALGTGLKIPYFITIGRSADLTVTPYLSSRTRTVELRYRQAFRNGDLHLEGSVSRDDVLPGETRYYLFGRSAFELPRDFRLSFGIQTVSDDAYLLDYGYDDRDRLESNVSLTRTRRDEQIAARILSFRSLRAGEANSTQPTLVSETTYERRFEPPVLGGTATLSLGTLTAFRTSELATVGRDVARASAALAWQRSEVFGPGILATASAKVAADYYSVEDDPAFGSDTTRAAPELGLTLRWPLEKTGRGGARHVLEPVAMLAWSPDDLDPVPNEDSTLSEFDEANLLDFSRFPGTDGREEGLRLALGAGWTRYDPAGWSMGMTFGRIFRERDNGTFGTGTGLDGDSSDWLAAMWLDLPQGLSLVGRGLFDDSFEASKADLRLRYATPKFDLGTGFLYLAAAASEGRPDETAEWAFDASWRINANWTGRADGRYDFEAGRATSAGVGLGWENECVRLDLSLSRRFTSSTSVRPSTDFGLSIELTGFGTGGESGVPRRRCMN